MGRLVTYNFSLKVTDVKEAKFSFFLSFFFYRPIPSSKVLLENLTFKKFHDLEGNLTCIFISKYTN
jgi:hypothetical protein